MEAWRGPAHLPSAVGEAVAGEASQALKPGVCPGLQGGPDPAPRLTPSDERGAAAGCFGWSAV